MVSILRRTEKGATMSRLKTTKDERTEWRGDYDEDVDRLLDDADLAAELEQEVEQILKQRNECGRLAAEQGVIVAQLRQQLATVTTERDNARRDALLGALKVMEKELLKTLKALERLCPSCEHRKEIVNQ